MALMRAIRLFLVLLAVCACLPAKNSYHYKVTPVASRKNKKIKKHKAKKSKRSRGRFQQRVV